MASPAPQVRPKKEQSDLMDWLQFFLKTATVLIALAGAYLAWSEHETANNRDLVIREHEIATKSFRTQAYGV